MRSVGLRCCYGRGGRHDPFLFLGVDSAEPMKRSHRDTHSSAPADMRPAQLGPRTSTDVPRGAGWKRGRTLVFFFGLVPWKTFGAATAEAIGTTLSFFGGRQC